MAGSPLAGQAPGVVKIRLSGALLDVGTVAGLLVHATRPGTGIDLIDVSQPYPNRRGAGARLYLTAGQPGTGAQPPRRPAALPQLAAREDS